MNIMVPTPLSTTPRVLGSNPSRDNTFCYPQIVVRSLSVICVRFILVCKVTVGIFLMRELSYKRKVKEQKERL